MRSTRRLLFARNAIGQSWESGGNYLFCATTMDSNEDGTLLRNKQSCSVEGIKKGDINNWRQFWPYLRDSEERIQMCYKWDRFATSGLPPKWGTEKHSLFEVILSKLKCPQNSRFGRVSLFVVLSSLKPHLSGCVFCYGQGMN